ncbi:RICIN domain-containing protein [Catenuloplanes atrovinosus]|uniref:PAS domain-containing protein n=1 Tax=Catenuloplanes atrovinosus TaxID=137266 RepID=A0AAE3YQ63_9ACTN|nr:RICIN domain-containing protein [Catenuloplanes atrovinosus]MDR7275766.1 PAS domain-containing protein [Catenuloplanes atrovinosus]
MRRRFAVRSVAASAAAVLMSVFFVAPAQAAFYRQWRNGNSTQCMGTNNGYTTNGTVVIQWGCNNNPDQKWLDVPLDDGEWYRIQNLADPTKCLGVMNGSTTPGAQIIIWDCNGNWDQQWTLVAFNGQYVFYNRASYRIIGIAGASRTPGGGAVLWDWQNNPDQRWY